MSSETGVPGNWKENVAYPSYPSVKNR